MPQLHERATPNGFIFEKRPAVHTMNFVDKNRRIKSSMNASRVMVNSNGGILPDRVLCIFDFAPRERKIDVEERIRSRENAKYRYMQIYEYMSVQFTTKDGSSDAQTNHYRSEREFNIGSTRNEMHSVPV